MKHSFPKVRFHRLLARQTGVVEDSLVHILNTPISSEDNHGLRHRVHDLPQLTFGFSDLFKGDIQRRLGAITLNRDSGDVTRVSNELYFARGRFTNFTKIHAERAQHLSVVPDDWVGPASKEPC